MPEMDGFQLIESCLLDPDLRGVSVIVVSAEADRDTISKALICGARDYIIKPYSPQSLDGKIKKLLETRRV